MHMRSPIVLLATALASACASGSGPAVPVGAVASASAALEPAAQLGSETDRAAVMAAVRTTFDAMRAKDTVLLRSVMDSGARLVTTASRAGAPVIRSSSISSFIEAVGGASARLDERIFEPEIRITDNMATVLVRYTFWANGQLSHCGYDAFQLARTPAGWKIVAITDTQRRDGCAAFEG